MQSKNSSSVVLDVNAGNPAQDPEPSPELAPVEAAPGDPFRILILGDFSGCENRPALGSRQPRRIDRDIFDDVLKSMRAQVTLRLGSTATVRLNFTALADFEPDSIFERCELFHGSAPIQYAESGHAQAHPSIEAAAARLTSGSLLDQIVEQTDSHDELQSVIDRLVAPHLVAPSEDRSAQDQVHSVLMRAILHHPQFQALEAAWRALDWLTRGLDTDGALSLEILDVTRDELESGIEDLSRLLVQPEPWAVIAGNYVFDRSARDVALLQRVGALARRAGAPWIGESAPPDEDSKDLDSKDLDSKDLDSKDSQWLALRDSPEARWIGLALPRFLARMPYGRGTYAIESFPFEEISGRPEHSDFLWANPAFACAWLLGRAFNEYGWKFRPGVVRQIAGLPYYAFETGGEMQSQPCAEVLLTDAQIDFIQEHGLMALASMKNQDVAMLMRFQSIAQPVTALAGRWQ